MKKNIHPKLKSMIPIVEGIAKTFGKNCEVVLHDFRNLKNSIVTIENGHITGRTVESPMTELSLKRVTEGKTDQDIINYSEKSADGRVLKSSTMFIRDDAEEVIGCLCINLDITDFIGAKKFIEDIMKIGNQTKEEASENKVSVVLSDLVSNAIESTGKAVPYLAKNEKVQIVDQLDKQGAFLIKGAIDYVAEILQVSKYTIYNYLDEIKGDE